MSAHFENQIKDVYLTVNLNKLWKDNEMWLAECKSDIEREWFIRELSNTSEREGVCCVVCSKDKNIIYERRRDKKYYYDMRFPQTGARFDYNFGNVKHNNILFIFDRVDKFSWLEANNPCILESNTLFGKNISIIVIYAIESLPLKVTLIDKKKNTKIINGTTAFPSSTPILTSTFAYFIKNSNDKIMYNAEQRKEFSMILKISLSERNELHMVAERGISGNIYSIYPWVPGFEIEKVDIHDLIRQFLSESLEPIHFIQSLQDECSVFSQLSKFDSPIVTEKNS